MLKIKTQTFESYDILSTIQMQIKLTLPYPFKRQFYEVTQNEFCSTVIHTDKYNYKQQQQYGLGAFLNRTQEGSIIEHNGQEVFLKIIQ